MSIFDDIAHTHDLKIICINILTEHVHMLIEKPADQSNEKVMQYIKGGSAYQLFKKINANRLEFRKLWGRGYRAIEVVGPDEEKKVIDYINGQKKAGIDKRSIGNLKH